MDLNDIDDGLETVEGVFQCHRCDEYVSVAKLDHDKHVLTYVCEHGHKSRLKDFY